MEDWLASFLPRFKESATTRVARTIEIAQQRDASAAVTIARDMHAVAGEAGLLGLAAIASLARAGEDQAKRLRSSQSTVDADALLALLTELKRAIELVAPANQPEGNR